MSEDYDLLNSGVFNGAHVEAMPKDEDEYKRANKGGMPVRNGQISGKIVGNTSVSVIMNWHRGGRAA